MSTALLGLSAIRERVEELAAQIGFHDTDRAVTYGDVRGDATPCIEVTDRYQFVISERGAEIERLATTDLDALLYWIFESITFGMAVSFEVRHRRPHEDSRRQWFQMQEDLLDSLSPAWGERKHRDHARILREHPFVDK